MILVEQPRGDASTNSEEICLSDVVPCQSSTSGSSTIEETTAVVHAQPVNQQVYRVDDDDEDSSSSSADDGDSNDQVAERSLGIPRTNVKNQVIDSSDVTVTTIHKNVFPGKVVLNQTIYNYPPEHVLNDLDAIDVVPPTEKVNNGAVGKEHETVEAKLSNASSQQLCAQDKDTSWWENRRLIVISGALLAGIAITISLIVYFLMSSRLSSCDLCIVSRSEWLAKPPKRNANPLGEIPAKYVIIIHTGKATCSTKSHCSDVVREIQRSDMEVFNRTDISYNWLVGGDDGLVYECRGWDVEGDHTKNYNHKSIGIGFIGTFRTEGPSVAQIDVGKKLIKKGVEENKISKEYILVGQRQCLQTSSESPGDAFYEIIKTWDRWSPACVSLR